MPTGPLTANANGVYPISITPFAADGSVDTDSLDRLLDFYAACGVPGITVLGILGEASRLSAAESLDIARRAIQRVGHRMQIIVGLDATGLDNMRTLAASYMDLGASGLMVAPASHVRHEQQALAYFEALTSAVGHETPLVLQDYPQYTGVYLSVNTLSELVRRHAGIQVIKHEEGSALRKISQLRALESSGSQRRVSILVGNSAIHLPQELARGADGANTGLSFPEMLTAVCAGFVCGNADAAEDIYDVFLPLVRHEQQPGIGLALRKEIFRRRGLIADSRARTPGPALDAEDHRELDQLLKRLVRRLHDSGHASLIQQYHLPAQH